MTIITYDTKILNDGLTRIDYKEIKNIKSITLIGLLNNYLLINYRYKNKEYNLFEWEEHKIPIKYHIEIKEE